jgi:hypothetical protein
MQIASVWLELEEGAQIRMEKSVVGEVIQVVEGLPSKPETLSLNPSALKKREKSLLG